MINKKFIQAFIQGAYVIFIFLSPAYLYLINSEEKNLYEICTIFSISFITVSIVISFIENIFLKLSKRTSEIIFYWLLSSYLITLIYYIAYFHSFPNLFDNYLYLYLLTAYIIWLSLLSFQKYPGPITEAHGDFPAFYASANSVFDKKNWKNQYYVGDFQSGDYIYLKLTPIPVFITVSLFRVFGKNTLSLNVWLLLSATLLVGLFTNYLSHTFSIANEHLIYIFLIIVSIPSFAVHFGLGSINLPSAISVFIISQQILLDAIQPLQLVIPLLFLFYYRPESRILAIILIFFLLIPFNPALMILSSLTLFILLMSIKKDFINQHIKNISLQYIVYSKENNSFSSLFGNNEGWYQVNRLLAISNFKNNIKNTRHSTIINQIFKHPLSFILYLLKLFPYTANAVFQFFIYPKTIHSKIIVPALFLSLCITFMSINNFQTLALTVFFFWNLTPLINPIATLRHQLIIIPILFMFLVHFSYSSEILIYIIFLTSFIISTSIFYLLSKKSQPALDLYSIAKIKADYAAFSSDKKIALVPANTLSLKIAAQLREIDKEVSILDSNDLKNYPEKITHIRKTADIHFDKVIILTTVYKYTIYQQLLESGVPSKIIDTTFFENIKLELEF